MRIGRVRITWIITFVLLTFVIFVYFLAEVGGEDDPVRQPSQPGPELSASPTPPAAAP